MLLVTTKATMSVRSGSWMGLRTLGIFTYVCRCWLDVALLPVAAKQAANK